MIIIIVIVIIIEHTHTHTHGGNIQSGALKEAIGRELFPQSLKEPF